MRWMNNMWSLSLQISLHLKSSGYVHNASYQTSPNLTLTGSMSRLMFYIATFQVKLTHLSVWCNWYGIKLLGCHRRDQRECDHGLAWDLWSTVKKQLDVQLGINIGQLLGKLDFLLGVCKIPVVVYWLLILRHVWHTNICGKWEATECCRGFCSCSPISPIKQERVSFHLCRF